MRLIRNVITISLSAMIIATALFAQEGHNHGTMKAEAEMKEAFGTVPVMFKVYPEHMRASAWEWFKSTGSPESAIPAKYVQLISLGVASQIPCDYCVYAHTTQAKMHGATEEEIQTAVVAAAETRHWSTVLNGADVNIEDFRAEWDGILEHIKKQSEGQ
jgi:AhpD family alkylhydroperoxidase